MTTKMNSTKNFPAVAEAIIMTFESTLGADWAYKGFQNIPLAFEGNIYTTEFKGAEVLLTVVNEATGNPVALSEMNNDVICMMASMCGNLEPVVNGTKVVVKFNRRSLYWTLVKYVGFVLAALIVAGGIYYAVQRYRD